MKFRKNYNKMDGFYFFIEIYSALIIKRLQLNSTKEVDIRPRTTYHNKAFSKLKRI